MNHSGKQMNCGRSKQTKQQPFLMTRGVCHARLNAPNGWQFSCVTNIWWLKGELSNLKISKFVSVCGKTLAGNLAGNNVCILLLILFLSKGKKEKQTNRQKQLVQPTPNDNNVNSYNSCIRYLLLCLVTLAPMTSQDRWMTGAPRGLGASMMSWSRSCHYDKKNRLLQSITQIASVTLQRWRFMRIDFQNCKFLTPTRYNL